MSAAHPLPAPPSAMLGRGLLAALLLLLAGASLSMLLPSNGVIKRKRPPADLPWFGSGINSVFVLEDGTWVVRRSAYLDRAQRYVISPSGALQAMSDRDAFRVGIEDDKSGGFSAGARLTEAGSVIGIKAGQPYRTWLTSLRQEGDPHYLNELPPAPELPLNYTAVTLPLEATIQGAPKTTDPQRSPLPNNAPAMRGPKSGFAINLNQHDRIEQFVILDGHWFYDIADSLAFIAPYLYVTSDRQRMLWRMRFEEPATGHARLTIDRGVRLDTPADTEQACRLGYDPVRGELFLVRGDGSRYWFDMDTLHRSGADRLPGVWEPEYAQFSLRPGMFSPYFGEPLSRRGYERVMQAAMLVFLASLLGLSLLWRPRWKSTSAATTADSNSSVPFANTSPDTDTE